MKNLPFSYAEIIEASKYFNLGYLLRIWDFDCLRLSNHIYPWSLTEPEANILYNEIIKYDLKSGFEIATAFGISSTVMGTALKQTGGKLVTMDAYIEETYNLESEMKHYSMKDKNVYENADGYKMAKSLFKHFELQDIIQLEVGWSPDDTGNIIEKSFGKNMLDFVFIDGGHSPEQIQADTEVIMDYLHEDCILFYHDHFSLLGETHVYLNKNKFKFLENYLTEFNLCSYARGKFLK